MKTNNALRERLRGMAFHLNKFSVRIGETKFEDELGAFLDEIEKEIRLAKMSVWEEISRDAIPMAVNPGEMNEEVMHVLRFNPAEKLNEFKK